MIWVLEEYLIQLGCKIVFTPLLGVCVKKEAVEDVSKHTISIESSLHFMNFLYSQPHVLYEKGSIQSGETSPGDLLQRKFHI